MQYLIYVLGNIIFAALDMSLSKSQCKFFWFNYNIEPKNLHCDFEKDISKAVKTIFPNINI